jgi:hypothetical protein
VHRETLVERFKVVNPSHGVALTTGNDLGGFLSWNDILTDVGQGALTTLFPPGSGAHYTSEYQGAATMQALT